MGIQDVIALAFVGGAVALILRQLFFLKRKCHNCACTCRPVKLSQSTGRNAKDSTSLG